MQEPVDAVITSAAGYPLDLTYYQSLKGITAAAHIVKPAGKILLLAACEEGVGDKDFGRLVEENPSDRDFMAKIAHAPVIPNQWQMEKLALVTAKVEVSYYVPGLDPKYYASVWGTVYTSPEEAVASFTASLPPLASIALIPEGSYVLGHVQS